MCSPGSAQTASTSANVQPPAKTARRRNRRCSASSSSEWLQSIVARSVCCRSGNVARAGGEDLEGVAETLEQRLRSQEPETGGSEFESERQAVEAPADRRDGLGVLRRQLERASGHLRARRTARSPDTSRATRPRPDRTAGKLQRVERVLPLGGDPEWRPARSHDPQPRAALDHARHVRSRRHDLLEVVQEQKCLLVTDQYGDALPECPFFGFLHVQRIRESGDELRRIRHVGQRDERDTVQELGREQPAQLDDDARLPNTAGARDRNDPMFVRQSAKPTPDQRLGRRVAWSAPAGCSADWQSARPCLRAPPEPAPRRPRPRLRRARTGARRS